MYIFFTFLVSLKVPSWSVRVSTPVRWPLTWLHKHVNKTTVVVEMLNNSHTSMKIIIWTGMTEFQCVADAHLQRSMSRPPTATPAPVNHPGCDASSGWLTAELRPDEFEWRLKMEMQMRADAFTWRRICQKMTAVTRQPHGRCFLSADGRKQKAAL